MSIFEDNMPIDFESIDYDYTKDTKEKKTCVCSCAKCKISYNIVHKETLQQFAVGSSCINRFVDEHFTKKYITLK